MMEEGLWDMAGSHDEGREGQQAGSVSRSSHKLRREVLGACKEPGNGSGIKMVEIFKAFQGMNRQSSLP